jgi:hypothetical protein
MTLVMVNWSNMTDFSQLPGQANVVTGGSFWFGVLILVFVVVLLLLLVYGFETALLVSSWLSLVIGMLLSFADLVNWLLVLPFVAIILFMFLYINHNRNKT